MIHILAEHKEFQDLVFEEVDRVVGKNRKPSVADKEKMHFSRAFVLEMFRFGSVSPILIPHYTTKDTSVGTYQIPADTTVIATSRSIHHDSSFWQNPYKFDPTRFLNIETKKLLPPSHENMKHLLSFGGGLRGCPGEAFAKSRLFLFLTSIIQKFEIETDSEYGLPVCDPNEFDLGLVLSPKNFYVKFKPRF